jgi:hypothetical protein
LCKDNADATSPSFRTAAMMIDMPALLAIAALGWGLSLCSYRFVASRRGWPVGALHADLPAVPMIIGLFAIFVAIAFASARGGGLWDVGGTIFVFGVLLAIFWTGFLRVGSQVSIVLAPLATALLIFVWQAIGPYETRVGVPTPPLTVEVG